MTELFLTLIIIFAFICAVCVIVSIGSRKKVFPIISVCCCVAIAALTLCCAVEVKNGENQPSSSQTVATLSGGKAEKQTGNSAEKEITETAEIAETDSADRIVYITKTGSKYHYSYNCSDVDFYECTLSEALEMGLEPCGKCVD